MIDCHTHLQPHGQAPPITRERIEQYVEVALARGLTHVSFTEHLFRFQEAFDALFGRWDDDPSRYGEGSDGMSHELKAGTARVTITPPVGLHLQGYNRGRPSEGIRDELYARATAAGAEVLAPLYDTDYGSRDFAVRDPEGNRWSFGTYRGHPRRR